MEPFIGQIMPFGSGFTGGVRVAAGDVNGDAATSSSDDRWIIIQSMSSPIYR